MTRKYHNHTLQTNPGHHEEEIQNTNSHTTTGTQFKFLTQRDDCKDINYCITKQGPPPHIHQEQQLTMNQQQQNQAFEWTAAGTTVFF